MNTRTNTRERLRGAFQRCNAGARGSATLPRHIRRMRSRRATPVGRGAQPYRAAYPRMCSRRATAVARERNPTASHAQECVPEVQRRSARERNPTTPHTQECVPNVERRSLTHSADGGDRTHTLLPVLDFESSASANSATSAFCEEETTKPFATKRKRQRRQLATLKQMHKSRKQESGVAGVAGVQRITGNKCLVESAGSRVEFITWKLMDHRYSPKSRLILNSCNS